MIHTPFEVILRDFETFFNCPLQPDRNESCLIKMGIGLSVQLELYGHNQLLIGCRLGSLPLSRYRDQVIRAALKSHEVGGIVSGSFGFSQKSHELILFLFINRQHLMPHDIATFMPPFIHKAKLWADAIAKGEVPSVEQAVSQPSPLDAFGLRS